MCSALGLAWLLAAPPADAAQCKPWPGEPDPLPTREDPDPGRATWARLRMRELAGAARAAEEMDMLRARQLWRRLLCMDPSNDEALKGVLRSRAVSVHKPPLVAAPFESVQVKDSWSALAAPIGLSANGSHRRAGRDPEEAVAQRLEALRAEVRTLDEQVRAARFESAIESSVSLRERLAKAPGGASRDQLLARTEVLVATAELALGRQDDAATSLRRALQADPGLRLDPGTTSPKVMRALDAARQAGDR